MIEQWDLYENSDHENRKHENMFSRIVGRIDGAGNVAICEQYFEYGSWHTHTRIVLQAAVAGDFAKRLAAWWEGE